MTEFRDWFDGSEVVDAKGDPLIVWHGSKHQFERFEKYDQVNQGHGPIFFFTTDKKYASNYGNPRPYYLSAKNIFDTKKPAHMSLWRRYLGKEMKRWEVLGIFFTDDRNFASRFTIHGEYDSLTGKETYKPGLHPHIFEAYLRIESPIDLTKHSMANAERVATAFDKLSVEEAYEMLPSTKGSKQLQQSLAFVGREELQRRGFDGIINRVMYGGKMRTEYIVFSPGQIKSIDNDGSFDENDPSIMSNPSLEAEAEKILRRTIK